MRPNNKKQAYRPSGNAISIKEKEANLLAQAISLHQQGRLDEAKSIYEYLSTKNPNDFDSLHLLGVIAIQTSQPHLAVKLITKSIALNPKNARAHYNLGAALQELKKFELAVTSYDKAINFDSKYSQAYSNRGAALKELNQLEAALTSYDKAIFINPDNANDHSNRGFILHELKNFECALTSHDNAIRLKPDLAEAHSNRGITLINLNQFEEALASFDTAININPNRAEDHSNRGLVLMRLKLFDAALDCCNQAILMNPELLQAYKNRAATLIELKQPHNAITDLELVLSLSVNSDYIFGLLLQTRMQLCDWYNFKIGVAKLIAEINANVKSSTGFPILALTTSLPLQHKATKALIINSYPLNSSLGPILKRARQKKIRIGYYSADFHNHATAYLMAELFESHDKSKFELIAFSFGPDTKDEMQVRVSQAFDQFINVTSLSDKSVAQLSRELFIDIAIDLKGLTLDARLGIFSFKAAPIQVSYLGYPGSLGADYIDYLIADKTLIPAESQQHYSEKIVYLPNSYQVNDRHRVIAPTQFTKQALGLPQDAFVFCCFNNNYKITPDVFDSWVRILKAVDTSVLWLLEDNATAALNLQKEAALRGLDPARLVFAKRMELPEHLARHKAADLFLDTLPYNAHTTASDALWAGLPLLTCMGESFASRVAASLLNAIGLPELITQTPEGYEALAIELATKPGKLQSIKTKLAANRLSTPLFDTALFTKHIEAAYVQMYEFYQADLPPSHIQVSA